MKNLYFVLLLILFINSCPSELVKGTIWYGKAEQNTDEINIKMHLYNDSTINVYIESGETNSIKFSGIYTLTNDGSFHAELDAYYDEKGTPGMDNVDLELSGVLYYYQGYGNGDYTKYVEPITGNSFKYEDSWNLTLLK